MIIYNYQRLEREWLKKYDKFIQNHGNKHHELYENPNISKNPNLTWEIIKNNPDKSWNWDEISANSNITWEIIKNNPDKPWDWREISYSSRITWEIIESNPDKPWDWVQISQN